MKEKTFFSMGKWTSLYDENGNCTSVVYDDAYPRLMNVESLDKADYENRWKEIIHPDDREMVDAVYEDVFAKHPEGKDYDMEYRMMVGTEYHWFHNYGHCTRRADGTVSRIDGVLFDIQDVVVAQNTQKAITQNYTRILALEDDFEVLYDVELETGHYDIFVKGQTFGDVNNNLINNNSFFDDVEKNLNVVHPEDQQGNYDTTRPEFIREALSKNDHFDRYYRLMVDGKPAWARMRTVYKDAEKKNIIIGVFNAENDIRAKQIAEQKKQLEESLTFTNYFLNTYESAYYIDLNTRKYTVYKAPESALVRGMIDGKDYLVSLALYFKQVAHPEDLEELLKLIQPETIKKRTAEDEISYPYRRTSADKERIIRMQIIRGADEDHAAIGFRDITEEYEEQQKHLLGAVPLSSDVLAKANVGMWAFELDEGQPPRMYGDETMIGLVGLKHQVPPEDMYHAWYDNIDDGSYDLVTDAVNKMVSGEHAEVQYPWHYPDGRTIMVRCGGVRNKEYTKGIRIEGTHQDVTQTLHYDEEERARAKQIENDLRMQRLRGDLLAYISDNEPDLDNAISYFGNRILEISGCDQVVYREFGGRKIVRNAPGYEEIPESICSKCPFAKFDCEAFKESGTVLMNDCSKGYHGMMAPENCPAKSSYMQLIYSGGELVGKLTVHFLNEYHTFTENGIALMKIIATYLGLMIGRIKEKQADIARIEAEFSNKAKTEFLFNMSHDIRTPMNAILGYTDIAINHIDEPDRVSDSLKKIKTSGGHLLSLINDILEMSRIEAGRLEIVNEPINAYDVSEGVINMSQALASTKDITFSAKIDNLKNPYLYADELHTNQVIINLISNAMKYTNPGGRVDYRIDQISDPVDGIAWYRVSVKDNGIGMSEEFQRHLFESFSREQNATVSRQEGAGLGLAIVKRILDMIGGTIRVKSKQGEGSEFIVELPLEVMDEAAIEAYKAAHAKKEETSESSVLKGRRALLVEDNEMNREIAEEILSEAGMIIETAADGSLAVKMLKKKGPVYYDFILMDIQMPVMNGYEATKAIREMYPDAAIPIIALSANAFEEDKKASLDAGMNDHVAKPINIDTLKNTLAKYL